jgi:hypothetical protein
MAVRPLARTRVAREQLSVGDADQRAPVRAVTVQLPVAVADSRTDGYGAGARSVGAASACSARASVVRARR